MQHLSLKTEGSGAQALRNHILEKQKVGNTVNVPMNCFLNSTQYKDKFDQYDNVMKAQPIKPTEGNIGGHRFRGVSAYKHEMNSKSHHEQASGKMLHDYYTEQRTRIKNFSIGQRRGTLG